MFIPALESSSPTSKSSGASFEAFKYEILLLCCYLYNYKGRTLFEKQLFWRSTLWLINCDFWSLVLASAELQDSPVCLSFFLSSSSSLSLSLHSLHCCHLSSFPSCHYNIGPLSSADCDSHKQGKKERERKWWCIVNIQRINPSASFYPSFFPSHYVCPTFPKGLLDIYWGLFELQQWGQTVCLIGTSIASASLQAFFFLPFHAGALYSKQRCI